MKGDDKIVDGSIRGAAPSRVIHKFPISFGLPTRIQRVVRTLHVGHQNGTVMLWAEVVPEDEPGAELTRIYSIAATGDRIRNPKAVPVGTVQIDQFVWHVYEVLA